MDLRCFFFLCGPAGKNHQPSALRSSAVYLDANLWPWWLKGFQGHLLSRSQSSFKIQCIEKPLTDNLEALHHLSM